MDEHERRASEWIASLPEGAEVGWGSHHVSDGYASGWVDVYVPMMSAAVGWSWSWTIDAPEYLDLPDTPVAVDDPFTIIVPRDSELRMTLAPGAARGTPVRVRLVTPSGVEDLTGRIDSEWDAYRARYGDDDWRQQQEWKWQSMQGTEPWTLLGHEQPPSARRIVDPAGDTVVLPVWSSDALCRAIEDWCAERGRPDVRWVFREEPISPAVDEARRLAEEWRDGHDD